MNLPISVIVPLQSHRKDFFERFCLPSIERNSPQEVIIIDEEGTAPVKRNKGAMLAKCSFLFFCDDDVILGRDCLDKYYRSINETVNGFAYSDFTWINTITNTSFIYKSKVFNKYELLKSNYISTMSLMKSECFCGFSDLPQYQDWDLWLTISKKFSGHYIPENLYIACSMDQGISKNINEKLRQSIIRKHQFNKSLILFC